MAFLIRSAFLAILVIEVSSEPCKKYDCRSEPPVHEPFVPAPPGQTPRCAKPGETFCETLDHYPHQLIKYLLEECRFNFNSILTDEHSNGYTYPRPKNNDTQGYYYKKAEHPLVYPENPRTFVPAKTYGPPTNNRAYQRRYPAVSSHPQSYSQSQSDHYVRESVSVSLPHQSAHLNLFYSNQPVITADFEQKMWVNRYYGVNDIAAVSRATRDNPFLQFASNNANNAKRQKRQSGSEYVSICPTKSSYIQPKAALNREGNWKYVVNINEETEEKYSQVVRSEVCTRDTCDGLCTLPAGYTSRCQQQYVQKRLVALEGSGDRLYNDIFWFPHGCMCQVVLNY